MTEDNGDVLTGEVEDIQPGENEFVETIHGRRMIFTKQSNGQGVMLKRLQQIAQRTGDYTRVFVAFLDVVDSTVTSEEDRVFLEEGILSGEIDLEDLIVLAREGRPKEPEVADDAEPVKKARKTASARRVRK